MGKFARAWETPAESLPMAVQIPAPAEKCRCGFGQVLYRIVAGRSLPWRISVEFQIACRGSGKASLVDIQIARGDLCVTMSKDSTGEQKIIARIYEDAACETLSQAM